MQDPVLGTIYPRTYDLDVIGNGRAWRVRVQCISYVGGRQYHYAAWILRSDGQPGFEFWGLTWKEAVHRAITAEQLRPEIKAA